jgi:hypothetical protein
VKRLSFRVRSSAWIALALITLAGLWLRADNLGLRSFSVDEIPHVFAARSLSAGGPPALPSGERYDRALVYTRTVAWAFARWGESEVTARVPGVVAGVLAIPVVYLIGASLFSRVGGLLAALLMAFSPDAVAMSRFVRMYAPVQLLVLITAGGVYLGLSGAGRGLAARVYVRLACLVAAAAVLLLAARLHSGAFVVIIPIGLYVVSMTGAVATVDGWLAALRSAYGAALATGLMGGTLVLLLNPDLVGDLSRQAAEPLPWVDPGGWSWKAYHYYMTDTYSHFWFLAPAATVTVLVTAFRPGLYMALLFWVPFIFLSTVVATQESRYLSLFIPFLFLILGEAGRQAGGLLWSRLRARLEAGLPWRRLVRPLVAFLFVASVAIVLASPSVTAAVKNRLKPFGQFPGVNYDQWREVAAYVAASDAPEAAVIANSDHLALYYLGRIDGRLLVPVQGAHPGDRDVERTPKGWRYRSFMTGVPAFSDLEDLKAAISRDAQGWVILERWHLAGSHGFAPGVQAFLAECLESRKTPADASLTVFFWNSGREAARCDARGRQTTSEILRVPRFSFDPDKSAEAQWLTSDSPRTSRPR